MSRLTLYNGLLLNLEGKIKEGRREFLPRQEAYEKLKQLTGQDFGYEVLRWRDWIRRDVRREEESWP
jgi:hypothetical protein